MAYSPVPTGTTADTISAAYWNTYLRDNFAASVPAIFSAKGDLAVASANQVGGNFSIGSDGKFLAADSTQILGVKWNAGSYALISEHVSSTLEASYTFSAIPQIYSHLKLHYYARGDDAGFTARYLYCRVNGDTGSNYDWCRTFLDDGGFPYVADALAVTMGFVGIITEDNADANYFEEGELTYLNYSRTTLQKVIDCKSLQHYTAGLYIDIFVNSVYWRNTAAITSITLWPQSGNFKIGSRFSLYGV